MTTVKPQRQTKVYFSTVVRAAPIPEGGEVALLDGHQHSEDVAICDHGLGVTAI